MAGRVQTAAVGVREIPPEVDFVYVMRRDSDYVASQIAQRLTAESEVPAITAAYDRAVEKLADGVLSAFGSRHEHPAVDLLDSRDIHARRLELIAEFDGATVISMDPLMEGGVLPLAFSRCYRPGGIEFIEMVARPGHPSLEEQVERITAQAAGGSIVVVEDDFYTGATLTATLGEHLGQLVGDVVGVVAGTKVGLAEPSFPVLPAVRYRCSDGRDPLEKVDLGDPRDYVVGVSGLVCRLPSGRLGRLPYVLPFVSATARASIPEVAEAEFSALALSLSREFYVDLDAIAGQPVKLRVCDPAFVSACEELLGITADTAMVDVLDTVAGLDSMIAG